MSALQENKQDYDTGKKFRLVVRSAEEAVRVIREKLGDKAKVISVRQLGGEGLKRFISSPKLEVIAQVQEEVIEQPEEPNQNNKQESTPPTNKTAKSHESKNAQGVDAGPNILATDSIENQSKPASQEAKENYQLLSKFGFDHSLLSDIQTWSVWGKLKDAPVGEMLKEITAGLSDRYRGVEEKETTEKIALLGAPGVGKTTTLCKFLAHEVFMNKTTPCVLKVENGIPNPDDALRIFCEVVGVTLYRETESLPEISKDRPLFLDFPGLSISEVDEWREAKDVLDLLNVKTRVLVVNGAYDRDIINKSIRNARHLNATHLAITHYDEISNSTKLWPVVLNSMLVPICVCDGQNVTGDFSTSVLNQLISKTFPKELYSKGFSTYQRI